MNLSKETIELIEKEYKNVLFPFRSASAIFGATSVLTNPSVLKSANLYTQEDCLGFAEWLYNHKLDFQSTAINRTLVGVDLVYYTIPQLYELYLKKQTT
jgi:hypothetical protein